MFCKICYDNNNLIFNTHNVRDKLGYTICPTLLNFTCPICGCKGHTKSYCKVEYDIHDIIWGIGLKTMIGKSWADECNA